MSKKTNISAITWRISAVNANLECLKLLKHVLTGNSIIDTIEQKGNRIEVYATKFYTKRPITFSSQIDLQPVKVNQGNSYYYYDELQIFMDTGNIHAKGMFSGFVDDNDETVAEPFDIDILKNVDELLEDDPLKILDAIKNSRLIM